MNLFQVPLCSLLPDILITAKYLLNLKRVLKHFSLSVLAASSLLIGTVLADDSAAAKPSGNSVQDLAGIPIAFQAEHSLWTSAEESGSSDHYQNYLERFPDGVCSDLAANRVMEATAWEVVKGSFNARAIESYLATNSSAKFAMVALDKLLEAYSGEAIEIGPNALVPSRVRRAIRELPPLVECKAEDFLKHENVIAAVAAQAEEARIAENKRIAEEKRLAEERRLAEEQRRMEEARKAEAARIAEEQRIEEERRAEEQRLIAEKRRKAQRKTIIAEATVLVPLIEAYAKTGPDGIDLLRLVELFHKVTPILQGKWSEELHESYRELSAFVVKDESFIVFQEEDRVRREEAR